MTRSSWVVALSLAGLTMPATHAQQRPPERGRAAAPIAPPAPPAAAGATDAYRIGAEDLLDISVWNNEAVSRVVPVRPDGRISLPLMPDVMAAGLTSLELREVLRRGLAAYINSPEVSVVVKEVHSFKVSVLGEVKNPGRYELKSRANVLDALALAGGLNDYAARSRIVIMRQTGGKVNKTVFNYAKFLSDPAQASPELQPGDVVVVP